jgi:hypothetical protein
MIVAGYLSFVGGHHFGLHPEGVPTVALFGWSGVTGDLRPAHFAALGYTAPKLAVFRLALLELPLIPLG